MVFSSFSVRRLIQAISALSLLIVVTRAQSLLPPTPLSLDSLAEFSSPGANWQLAGGIGGDPRREAHLTPLPGRGILLNLLTGAAAGSLATTWQHGDLELDLDFLLPAGAHPAILLQGRYAIDLSEGGRAAGLWQHLHVEFQAPRFDAAGKKVKNARFTKIAFNGFTTGEEIELAGRAPASVFPDEGPLGPLFLASGGSPVAFRAITSKRSDPALVIGVENLSYAFHSGEYQEIANYGAEPPKSVGAPASFAADAIEKTGKFALVFEGTLVAPSAGDYVFSAESQGPIRLLVDGRSALTSNDQGVPSLVRLEAGKHSFRLDFIHTSWRPPFFRLMAEGPGIAPQTLSAQRGRAPSARSRQLLIEPGDRIRLQRSFVPFEPKKRLYALNVGTPAGVHYAYDFETGAILRVWRGHFLDMFEMWDGRGENQIAKSVGPALTFNAKPAVALLERSTYNWPDAPEALWSSQGYTLEPDGQPVFLAKLASLEIRDRIAPAPNGSGLTRTLNLRGRNTEWETWVMLAEAPSITPQPGGGGYIVGDRSYYIDLPADSAVRPVVRTRNGSQQLVVPVSAKDLEKPIVYSFVW